MTGFWKKGFRSAMLLAFISAQIQGDVAVAAQGRTTSASTRKAAPSGAKGASSRGSNQKSRSSQAGSSRPSADSKWRILSSDTHHIGSKDITIQNFERIVRMGELEIPVASVTHTIQEQSTDPRQKLTPQKVAEQTRKAAEIPPWMASKRGDTWVYVSDHKAANRYITLFYREHNGLVSISISSIRRVFLLPVLAETEVMQREMARQIEKFSQGKPAKTASLWENALQLIERVRGEKILPQAQAQVPSTDVSRFFYDALGRLNGPAATDFLNKYYNQLQPGSGANLGNVFNGMQMDLANLGDYANRGLNAVDRFQGQVDRGMNQVDRGLDIAQRGVDTARDGVNAVNRATDMAREQSDKAIAAAKDISRETNQTIRESVDKTNENARKIVNKMTSFETAFIMGLGGAIGASVGTLVVNVVTSVGAWAVKSLWNAIFGLIDDDTRQQINANTQDGLNQLERQSKNLTAVEMEIDKNIAALMFATSHNAEDLAGLAGAMGLKAQVAADIETTKLKNGLRAQMGARLAPGEDAGDPTICALNANEFKAVAAGLSATAPILAAAAAEGGRAGVVNKICKDIVNLLIAWRGAEAELQVARGMVLDGMKVMLGETSKKAFRSGDPLASPRRTLNSCLSSVSDLREKASDLDRYSCAGKSQWTTECEPYQRAMAAVARQEELCKQIDQLDRSRDFSLDFMYVTEGLSHQMRQAQMMYEKLARANCPAGQCAEEGEFSKLRRRYKEKLLTAKNYGCNIPGFLEDHLEDPSTPHALANGSNPAASVTGGPSGGFGPSPGAPIGAAPNPYPSSAGSQRLGPPVRLAPGNRPDAQRPSNQGLVVAPSRDEARPGEQTFPTYTFGSNHRVELIYGDHMGYR